MVPALCVTGHSAAGQDRGVLSCQHAGLQLGRGFWGLAQSRWSSPGKISPPSPSLWLGRENWPIWDTSKICNQGYNGKDFSTSKSWLPLLLCSMSQNKRYTPGWPRRESKLKYISVLKNISCGNEGHDCGFKLYWKGLLFVHQKHLPGITDPIFISFASFCLMEPKTWLLQSNTETHRCKLIDWFMLKPCCQ